MGAESNFRDAEDGWAILQFEIGGLLAAHPDAHIFTATRSGRTVECCRNASTCQALDS